jgi:hypothetical protein
MAKFDISKNNLGAVGTKLLAEALDGNQIITELNISGNEATWDGRKHGEMSGVTALANAIPGMRDISTVVVNTFPLPIQDIKVKAELDFSDKKLKAEDAIIIAALISSNVGRTIFPHPCSLISLSMTRGAYYQ